MFLDVSQLPPSLWSCRPVWPVRCMGKPAGCWGKDLSPKIIERVLVPSTPAGCHREDRFLQTPCDSEANAERTSVTVQVRPAEWRRGGRGKEGGGGRLVLLLWSTWDSPLHSLCLLVPVCFTSVFSPDCACPHCVESLHTTSRVIMKSFCSCVSRQIVAPGLQVMI